MIVHTVEVGKENLKSTDKTGHKNIYVGGSESDIRYRDMLVNGKHRWELYTNSTIDFITFDRNTNKELSECKSVIDGKISKSDGVMIIVTPNTKKDPLASMEIEIAISKNIPIVGINIDKNQKDVVPDKLKGKITTYGWEWFAEFINKL